MGFSRFYKHGFIYQGSSDRTTLRRLVDELRLRDGAGGIGAEAHGDVGQQLQLTLSDLQGLGVHRLASPQHLGLESLGLGFIGLRARTPPPGTAGPQGALPVLLVIARQDPQGLLLPAVQCIREAARRLQLEPGARVYIGAGGSAAAAGHHRAGETVWFKVQVLRQPT